MRNSVGTDKPAALVQVELEFGSVGFCGRRKTGERGKKPSEQGREPTTNPSHKGGRGALIHCATCVPTKRVLDFQLATSLSQIQQLIV